MKKEIENKLRRVFKIDNDYENYRGVLNSVELTGQLG